MASNALKAAAVVLTVVFVLAILGVSIAILVTVLNILNGQDKNVSEESGTTEAIKDNNNRGVPEAPVIDAKDPRYKTYKDTDDILSAWMDTSVNPCDDFYRYACGSGEGNGAISPRAGSDMRNDELQIEMYKNDAYFETAPKPLKQLKHYFDKCVTSDATEDAVNEVVKQKVEAMKAAANMSFPLLYQNEHIDALQPDQLAKLIGIARGELGVYTLLSIDIYFDWKEPDTINTRVYVDEAHTNYTPDIYDDWESHKDEFIDEVISNANMLANALGLPHLNQDQLQIDADQIILMERALNEYVADTASRRLFGRQYNPMKLSAAQAAAPAYNWVELIKATLAKANAAEKVTSDLEVIVQEPELIFKLSADILAGRFTASTIANYIQYHSALGVLSSLPDIAGSTTSRASTKFKKRMHNDRHKTKISQKSHKESRKINQHFEATYTDKEYTCYEMVRDNMVNAGDRVFADAAFPTEESRQDMKKQVTEFTNWMISGFRTQIDMINWMSIDSKKAAYGKLDNIQLNIGFPDWVTDNDDLTDYYKDLSFTETSSSIEVYTAVLDFNLMKGVENFRLEAKRDRADFMSAVGVTNSYYLDAINAMIIWAGILHTPYMNPDYPSSFAFGLQAAQTGHELAHAFDDEGVQWDGLGALTDWMDDESMQNFRSTCADCVIDEYNQFCPLPAGKPCVNGIQTQGENLADNGGMQAAYKAFKAYEALNGPDPRLPSVGKVFTTDQLFFLGFAYRWCKPEQTDEDMENNILYETHAPYIYRVRGTLQNFPAFRTAFNCPIGHVYSPKDHCDVWTSLPFSP